MRLRLKADLTRIDFEDTYDGLGDRLEETGDDLNDDTFGGGPGETTKPVGKDFDFFGRTAQVSDAISEEQMRFSRQQAPSKSMSAFASSQTQPAKPARTGYEKYQNLEHVSDLQVDQSLWGSAPHASQARPTNTAPRSAAPARKMMSLEEVEAQMQARKSGVSQPQEPSQPVQSTTTTAPAEYGAIPQQTDRTASPYSHKQQQCIPLRQPQVELPATTPKAPQILHRPQQPITYPGSNGQLPQGVTGPSHGPGTGPKGRHTGQMHAQRPSQSEIPSFPPHGIITHPQQLLHLPEADRMAFLEEDAKRAKRNHKIFLLSKDNGLMTPQDKNFITRIQLQQLMAASGSTNDQDPDAVLSEDFYYQVHRQIRGGPRTNPQQPLSHFAQTYLFQTGGRHGGFRRQHRGGDNHMQRMEQQVQRAVEAAKAKPKNKQLVIEGSLGKISFSNSKTPKPLLNIRRPESSDTNKASWAQRKVTELTTNDRKTVLKDTEAIYTALMKIEDEARKEPPSPDAEADPAMIEKHIEWRNGMQELNEKLWSALKVLEPIDPGSPVPHPFIAILSYSKGKKVIPRVFRHMSSEQRITMLTMIVIHLDILDVVRLGQLQPEETQLPAASRESIDLFSASVTPTLFGYVSEAPLYNVIGLLGLILDRVNVTMIARTRVGLSILTMLASRATLVQQAGGTEDQEWQQWTQLYDRLFDTLEPVLGQVFPGSVNSGEDMYVWQFLAAIGSGASPEQQQRLVIAVKLVLPSRSFKADKV